MATSAVPALIDALVAAATTALPSVRVYDGYGVSSDPTDSLWVGIDDPYSASRADSSDSTQEPATMGTARKRTEVGTIRCAAVASTGLAGNAGQKAARDAVYAITAAVEQICRAAGNPALGATGVYVIGYGPRQTLYQDQTKNGSNATVIFDITFNARI